MQYDFSDGDHDRVATFDIETTSVRPADGEVVAVGVGVHEPGSPAGAAEYTVLRREGDDEAALVERGVAAVEDAGADLLVSYNGTGYDLDYLDGRMAALGREPVPVALHESGDHLDLMVPRRVRASAAGEDYPSLEACLSSYGIEPARTVWRGAELTNVRFGRELGPAYLDALGTPTGRNSARSWTTTS
ncbi:ribonuclease H-like domain-containing protein [Halosegnis marinus]|uniref:ribonuclease H-like domain-containing protein n=1 Tax=Halosegnis marinus TaxID=3034023 RepID=UPI003606B2EC